MDIYKTALRDDDEVGDMEYGERYVKYLDIRKEDKLRFWWTGSFRLLRWERCHLWLLSDVIFSFLWTFVIIVQLFHWNCWFWFPLIQHSIAVNCCWHCQYSPCCFRAPSGLMTTLLFVRRQFVFGNGVSSSTRAGVVLSRHHICCTFIQHECIGTPTASGRVNCCWPSPAVNLGFGSRGDPWFLFCSLQDFYVFWNGASSSTRRGVIHSIEHQSSKLLLSLAGLFLVKLLSFKYQNRY
jgi:hypothetical protein